MEKNGIKDGGIVTIAKALGANTNIKVLGLISEGAPSRNPATSFGILCLYRHENSRSTSPRLDAHVIRVYSDSEKVSVPRLVFSHAIHRHRIRANWSAGIGHSAADKHYPAEAGHHREFSDGGGVKGDCVCAQAQQ